MRASSSASSASTTRPIKSRRPLFALAVTSAVLAPIAYLAMFSTFHAYDDEGYFLLTLRHYVQGRPLFTEALPIYGPFYYEVVGGVFKLLGVLPDHDAGRWLTVVVWLASSLLGGWAVWRLTHSALLGLAAQLVTFKALDALVNEPANPAGLVGLLLLALVAAIASTRGRPRSTAAVVGGLIAAMFLVKVNVGVYAAMAVAFAWAASLPQASRRWLFPLVASLVVVAPFGLTAALRTDPSVLAFGAVVALAAAAVFVAAWTGAPRPAAPSSAWIAAGGLGLAVPVIGIALLGGTRVGDMWRGLVVLPLQFPTVFALPATVSPLAGVWAALCVGAAIAATSRLPARISPGGAGLVRILAGALTWAGILLLPSATYLFTVPLAWLAVRSPVGDDPTGPYPRLLVSILAVTAVLEDYPVAGTQLSLGAIPLVAAAAIILADGIRQCRLASAQQRLPGVAAAVGAPGALVVNAAAVALLALVVAGNFASATPLALPGAASLRLPEHQSSQLQEVVATLHDNCTAFITLPGMSSFYLWSGQDPPAELSSEVWWLVLNSEQQQAIVDRLQGISGLCVVKNQSLVAFWARGRQPADRPLLRFIDSDFTVLGSYGDYQVLARSPAAS